MQNVHFNINFAQVTATSHKINKTEATSSFFPIKMIAKQEWTQSNTQQNIQLLYPIMGAIINDELTTAGSPP